MLGIEYVLVSLILAKWFSILREPGELLSFYNRMLISWDHDYLDFEYDKDLNFGENLIDFLATLLENAKPFFYKVLTCSMCHSGYLAIYCIFAYDQDFIILPITMVAYYLLSKVKFQ